MLYLMSNIAVSQTYVRIYYLVQQADSMWRFNFPQNYATSVYY